MNWISKYFWLILIGGNCLNTLIFSLRARSTLKVRPELYDGYRRIIFGTLVLFNIPFVIIGIGILTGQVSDMTQYLYPSLNNIFTLLPQVSALVLVGVGFHWIFFARGAEFIVEHRELWGTYKSRIPSSVFGLKLVYLFCTVVAVLVSLISFNFDGPGIPKNKDVQASQSESNHPKIRRFLLKNGYRNKPPDPQYEYIRFIYGQINPTSITIHYVEMIDEPLRPKNEVKDDFELTGEDYQKCLEILQKTSFKPKSPAEVTPGGEIFNVTLVDENEQKQQGEPDNKEEWVQFLREIRKGRAGEGKEPQS